MATGALVASLAALDGDECRRLLGCYEVGRLGVVRGEYPLIIPVNYATFEDRIVVRTGPGAKFVSARARRVSFEVDGIDEPSRTGWSVLVLGFAVELRPGDPRYAAIAALPLEPWAPGDRSKLLIITPVSVTGRRITRSVSPT